MDKIVLSLINWAGKPHVSQKYKTSIKKKIEECKKCLKKHEKCKCETH